MSVCRPPRLPMSAATGCSRTSRTKAGVDCESGRGRPRPQREQHGLVPPGARRIGLMADSTCVHSRWPGAVGAGAGDLIWPEGDRQGVTATPATTARHRWIDAQPRPGTAAGVAAACQQARMGGCRRCAQAPPRGARGPAPRLDTALPASSQRARREPPDHVGIRRTSSALGVGGAGDHWQRGQAVLCCCSRSTTCPGRRRAGRRSQAASPAAVAKAIGVRTLNGPRVAVRRCQSSSRLSS